MSWIMCQDQRCVTEGLFQVNKIIILSHKQNVMLISPSLEEPSTYFVWVSYIEQSELEKFQKGKYIL